MVLLECSGFLQSKLRGFTQPNSQTALNVQWRAPSPGPRLPLGEGAGRLANFIFGLYILRSGACVHILLHTIVTYTTVSSYISFTNTASLMMMEGTTAGFASPRLVSACFACSEHHTHFARHDVDSVLTFQAPLRPCVDRTPMQNLISLARMRSEVPVSSPSPGLPQARFEQGTGNFISLLSNM